MSFVHSLPLSIAVILTGETPAPRNLIASEFPEYDAATLPADVTGEGWTDESYHNDAAPRFRHIATGVTVFVHAVDPDLRDIDFVDYPRFSAYVTDDEGCAVHESPAMDSDNWDDVLQFVRDVAAA